MGEAASSDTFLCRKRPTTFVRRCVECVARGEWPAHQRSALAARIKSLIASRVGVAGGGLAEERGVLGAHRLADRRHEFARVPSELKRKKSVDGMVWRVGGVQCVSDEGYMSHVCAERHRGRERRREGADCTDPRISRRMAAAILFPFVEGRV